MRRKEKGERMRSEERATMRKWRGKKKRGEEGR